MSSASCTSSCVAAALNTATSTSARRSRSVRGGARRTLGTAGEAARPHPGRRQRQLVSRDASLSAGSSSSAAAPGSGGARGDAYVVTPEQIEAFERDGFVHIPSVLTEEEMAEVEEPMGRFMRGEVLPEGKDLCDMSGATDRTPDAFTVFNAMLPRRYLPEMQGNIFERRAASIAEQLQRGRVLTQHICARCPPSLTYTFENTSITVVRESSECVANQHVVSPCAAGKKMTIDYDQLLAKRPNSPDSIFAWHQDLAYWPPLEEDPSTCTCWLAIDDSTVANGCMRFLPGSNAEPELRIHAPVNLGETRMGEDSSHALCTTLRAEDEARVRQVEIKRGDITVHDQRVVHGSGPNTSEGWRRAYVLAFRTEEVVAEERRLGFTHSHNDTFNWDAFHAWADKAEKGEA